MVSFFRIDHLIPCVRYLFPTKGKSHSFFCTLLRIKSIPLKAVISNLYTIISYRFYQKGTTIIQ